jgi:hypothetical protein
MNKMILLALTAGFFLAQPITANAERFSGTTRYRSTSPVVRGSLCFRAARIATPPNLRISLKELKFRANKFPGTLGTINGVKMGGLGSDPSEFALSTSAPIPNREGRCAVANTGGYFKRNSDGSLTVEVFQSVACNEGGVSKRAYVCEDRKYRGRLIPRTKK